jgi:hypothetical protein
MKGTSITIYTSDYSTQDMTIQEKRTANNTLSLLPKGLAA